VTLPPARLAPYDPQHLCPGCGSEGSKPVYHAQGLLAVFGSSPAWPCVQPVPGPAPISAHLCNKCDACGYEWMESVAPGMDVSSGE